MKVKKVDTVTSDEGLARLMIFDGDLKIDDAANFLIKLAREQRDHAIKYADEIMSQYTDDHIELKRIKNND